MSNDTNPTLFISNSMRIHELTMLYLKQLDLSNMSIPEIAQKYTDIKDEFYKTFKEQRKNM